MERVGEKRRESLLNYLCARVPNRMREKGKSADEPDLTMFTVLCASGSPIPRAATRLSEPPPEPRRGRQLAPVNWLENRAHLFEMKYSRILTPSFHTLCQFGFTSRKMSRNIDFPHTADSWVVHDRIDVNFRANI